MEPFLQLQTAFCKLQQLEDDEWKEFSKTLKIKHYHKGDFLIREGQTEQYIHFLNKGSTRHYFISEGKEKTVDFQFPGDFVTAYYSFIMQNPADIFIEALQDIEAVVISYNVLQNFYAKYHNAERIGRKMAEIQYAKRLRKEMDLLALTAEERYAKLMAQQPELVSGISVKHLSSYLGVQPESLSRIRKLYVRN
jgi:CRP/FNR family transcriptional regulator, anaerobic regulatory protein